MTDAPLTIAGMRVYGDQADPDGPWSTGLVQCRACGHRWTAVWPFSVIGHRLLECSQCHAQDSEEAEGT